MIFELVVLVLCSIACTSLELDVSIDQTEKCYVSRIQRDVYAHLGFRGWGVNSLELERNTYIADNASLPSLCLFEQATIESIVSVSESSDSKLEVHEKASSPDYQRWSTCGQCIWSSRRGEFIILDSSLESLEGKGKQKHKDNKDDVNRNPIDNNSTDDKDDKDIDSSNIELSSSSWKEFFHGGGGTENSREARNDRFTGRRVHPATLAALFDDSIDSKDSKDSKDSAREEKESPLKRNLVRVRRPVFIIPMLTLHPGHLAVDVLEQVHSAMLKTYGRVRKDALLVCEQ
jgi:hypothetical protein